jgi:hypothetical protein
MIIEEKKYRIACDDCSNEFMPWNTYDSEEEAESNLMDGWKKEGNRHLCDECIIDRELQRNI